MSSDRLGSRGLNKHYFIYAIIMLNYISVTCDRVDNVHVSLHRPFTSCLRASDFYH